MEEIEAQKPPLYQLSTPIRFLIAFLIGVPTTMMIPFTKLPTPIWWQPYTPFTALLLALLLGIARDPLVLQGRIEGKPLRNLVMKLILLIVGYFVFEIAMWYLGNFIPIFGYLSILFLPFMAGLVGAFVVSGGKPRGFSHFAGAFVWLGAAVANIIASIFDGIEIAKDPAVIKQFPTNTQASVVGNTLVVAVIIHVLALAIAAYAGGWGWRLRKRFLGWQSVRDGDAMEAATEKA
jgi:hypothetical protein